MKKTQLCSLFCCCLMAKTYALPPIEPPKTQLYLEGVTLQDDQIQSQDVHLNWDEVDYAEGYNLLYAEYPSFDNITPIDLGQATFINRTVPAGVAYWIGVQSYNVDGNSSVIDIYPLIIPAKSDSLEVPQLTQQRDGDQVTLTWEAVSEATGYRVHSNNVLDFAEANITDVGNVTTYNFVLPNSKFNLVGVEAYNAEMTSPFAAKLFTAHRRIVALISNEKEREGLLAGLKQFEDQFGNVELDIVTWETVDTVTTKVYSQETDQSSTRGYIDDPDVLALITTNSSSTLRASQSSEHPLVVAITATSTDLKVDEKVLLVSASNNSQIQTIREFLDKAVTTNQRMNSYAVVMEESASKGVYSFDLYLNLLKRAFDTETTVPLRSDTELFSQLVGTFNFSEEGEQVTMIADSLTMLKPDIVLYIGSANNFQTLYTQVPNQQWLGTDSLEDLISQDFESDAVKIVSLGSPEIGKGVHHSAYDTIGVIGQILSNIEGEPTQQKVLEAAYHLETKPYKGVTGTKSFTETDETGWYDILTSTPSGWVQ